MKRKFLEVALKGKHCIEQLYPYMFSIALSGALILKNIAFAAETNTSLFKTIVSALGGLAIASAAINGVMGAIAYAEAKSEGEGPGMSKAKNQIVAAILLGIVGAALAGGASTIEATIGNITF